jgi:citrate lyase subunit beta/citryl-CoA lyase
MCSALFLPASNPKAIVKARTLPCDVVILDLEDAVAPDMKAMARSAAVAAVNEGGFGSRALVVRVNGLETEWGRDDIAALVDAGVSTILAPKVSTAADVEAYEHCLGTTDVALWVMIETPRALFKLDEIGARAVGGPLRALVLGTNDLAKDLGARLDTAREPFLGALGLVVAAARAHGLLAFDGVFNDFEDDIGFAQQARQAVNFGFDGKSLIHPRQIELCNAAFAPDAAQLAWATKIVAAFAELGNQGKGAIRIDGKMVEPLHLAQARALIARSNVGG